MSKMLVSGLVAGVVMLIVMMANGFLWNALFPNIMTEYENTAMFRPYEDPLMYYMYVQPFVIGIAASWVYSNVKGISKRKKASSRGAMFGFYWWLIVSVPGMLVTYASFQVSPEMVMSWTVGLLAQLVLGGIVLAKMQK